jgi:hypothetical protein
MKTNKTKLLLSLLLTLRCIGSGTAVAQPERQGRGHFLEQEAPAQAGNRSEEEGFRRRRERFGEAGGGQLRAMRQQRIDRARTMAHRLLQDPTTPADIKAKAQRLDELLTTRERLEHDLQGKRQDFQQAHRQELEELRQLRERAETIRQNLRAAREKARAENIEKIQEMRRVTQEARETAQEIRRQYREN